MSFIAGVSRLTLFTVIFIPSHFDRTDWFAHTATFPHHFTRRSCRTLCEKMVIKKRKNFHSRIWAGAAEIISLSVVVLRRVRIWQTQAGSWVNDGGLRLHETSPLSPLGKSKTEPTGRARFISSRLQCAIREKSFLTAVLRRAGGEPVTQTDRLGPKWPTEACRSASFLMRIKGAPFMNSQTFDVLQPIFSSWPERETRRSSGLKPEVISQLW